MLDRVDLHAPPGEALARTLKTAIADFLALNSAGMGPLAIAGYEDLLTNLATVALFPPVASCLERPDAQCSPATIRRARDFIKTNAADPIRMSELSAHLGVPMRTLQASFRKWFGTSPREWLLECRLESARQRLEAADDALSVSRVAFECGFGDLSQFSARYRAKYGELPSATLATARRYGS
jgi:AraC-like DNA-binding protein